MSDLVGNRKCWFPHAKAHMSFFKMLALDSPCLNEPPRGKTNNVVSEQV